MTRRPRRYTGTSSPHRQCRRVIDGKIPGRIVVPGDEPESRDYSARRSSDPSVTLIYWGGLEPTFFTQRQVYVENREHMRTVRTHLYYRSELSIERDNVYVTQVKSRIGSFNTITLYLFIVRASLPSHISLLDEWHSSSRRTQFLRYNHEHHGCKGNVFRLRDRRSKNIANEEQGTDDALQENSTGTH